VRRFLLANAVYASLGIADSLLLISAELNVRQRLVRLGRDYSRENHFCVDPMPSFTLIAEGQSTQRSRSERASTVPRETDRRECWFDHDCGVEVRDEQS